MRKTILVIVGCMSILAATLFMGAPNTFAGDTQVKKERTKENAAAKSTKKSGSQERVDVMDQPTKKGVQSDSMTPGREKRKDVIDDVGSQGDLYPSTGGSTRKDFIDTIRN